MGYPHPSHPKETVVLSRYFGDPEARTYAGWVQARRVRGTPEGAGDEPRGVGGGGEGVRAPGPGRGRVSHRAQVVVHAQGGR